MSKEKVSVSTNVNRKKWIFIIAMIALASTIALYYATQHKKSTLAISYREVPVARGDLSVTILATGNVEPENRLAIKPPVAGRIETVLAKEGQMVKKGEVLAWMSSTERAALIDAARAQGEDEVKRWEENYKPTPILAPIDGTLILSNVESGQTFTNTDSVFVMSDRLTVIAQVDETDIAEIKLKQKASIVLDAYPNNKFPAFVNQIAFDATTVNNVTTYNVDVLPVSTPAFMRSGMTANVTFIVSSKENILVIPNDALHVKDKKYSVLIKSADNESPIEKIIDIGITDGKRTEVLSGLSEGQILLVAEMKPIKASEKTTNPFSPMAPRRTSH